MQANLHIGRVSVWPSTRSTQLSSEGIFRIEVEQSGRELVEFRATFAAHHGGAAVEKDLGLEHKTITDHADIRTIAKNLAQLTEKI